MIDTFYRIKILSSKGIKIHLHCFSYGRNISKELESLCESVRYYKRKRTIIKQFSHIPYIVISRKSKALLNELQKDYYPVLFDGLHTTYYLNHPALAGRKKIVRAHNVEHKYYKSLARNENNIFRKLYYLFESEKLKHYESSLSLADIVLSVSSAEHEYFSNKFNNSKLFFPFHPFEKVLSLPGRGSYLLYHGDLSINENAKVASLLIDNLFSKINFKCIIAGKNPSRYLARKVARYNNIELAADPDSYNMMKLISEAQIIMLWSLEYNGFKVKMLISAFTGRFCISNSILAKGYIPEEMFVVCDSYNEILQKIPELMKKDFTAEIIKDREILLLKGYNNDTNSEKLIEMIFTS